MQLNAGGSIFRLLAVYWALGPLPLGTLAIPLGVAAGAGRPCSPVGEAGLLGGGGMTGNNRIPAWERGCAAKSTYKTTENHCKQGTSSSL